MNDPEQFEKERYIDTINDYNSIIDEFQKLYEQTPACFRLALKFYSFREMLARLKFYCKKLRLSGFRD
jgi:hypothetical protein